MGSVFLLVVVLFLPETVFAEIRVGYVDVDKIHEQAPQVDVISKKLEDEFASRKDELIAASKSLRRMEEKLLRDMAIMTASERKGLERDLAARQRELKRSQNEYNEDLNIKSNEALQEFQRQVLETIKRLAEDEKYDLILHSGGGVAYFSDRVDVTDKVLDRLKKQ